MDSKRHFQLVQETTVPELQAQVFRYRHLKTGAEVLSVVCDDDNKVFGITFKTPPPDSSGIAHIMEHAVLCGSRKYPVKEPFVELLKGSLKTFLNAMTYADKTVYPVASANLKDFYNLMDVYLDAVFFPKISPEILQQEGWHYDVSPDSGSLKFKGVVYNEMKGAYASPGRAISRTSIRAVFPDTIYAHDSGGDPEEIPTLSYQNFRKFHEEFYHPSNARFFFYGDDDPGQRLVRLSEYLETFSARNINSDIVLQAPFMAPRRLEERYLTGDGGHGPQGAVTVNWGFPEIVGTEARLRLSILNYLLLGTPTAPLRKKLIDSGLGADLSGGGFHTGLRQPFFSTGLKGIDPQLADRIEELILVELERLSREGFARDSVEAALNAYEFNYRENNTGAYPRGLSLMLRALSGWLHNDNPIEPLFYEKPLTHLRTQLLGNPEIFGVLIRELFLENSHRATVVFKPDPNMAREREDLEKEKLEKTFATLSTGEIETLAAQARDLRILQSTPDSPENLAAIPSLTRGDLDPKHRAIPNTVNRIGTNTALFHDLFTGGIVYLKVAFPINGLPGHLLPYLRLFGRFLLEAGTHTSTPQQITERIDRYTGGIWRSNLTLADETGRASSWLTFNAKCLHQRIPEMMELLAEILREARLDNKARFRQIVLDVKSSQENSLSAAGHRLALRRLAAGRHQSAWLREAMGGIEHLFFLRELVERIDRDWQGVETDLRAIRDWVIQREGVLFNVTGEEEAWNLLEPHLSAFLEKFGARIGQGESWQESLG
ncbi:MAG TPA: insulinase family protein, partial [Calditrichia bacterium]|nr:insulinase family protein [Calditrichia bacterium]